MMTDDKPKETNLSSGVDVITNFTGNEIETAYIPPEAESENPIEDTVSENIQKDSEGILFDAEIHATDADGNPSVTKTGKYRKKRGVSTVTLKEKEKKADEIVKSKQGTYQAAHAASSLFVISGMAVFGDEWKPEEIEGHGNEKDMLDRAFYDYFESKEISDFPAGVALAVALVSYGAKRMTKPKTKSKLQGVKEWVFKKVATLKARKGTKKDGAHISGRKNEIGKDNNSKTNSEEPKK